jgi:hypothetical protein
MLPTTFNIFPPTTYFTVEKQYGISGTITKIYGNFAKRRGFEKSCKTVRQKNMFAN